MKRGGAGGLSFPASTPKSGSDLTWVDNQGLPADVEVVYKEITMGEPHGEIIGGR
jgi:hypothetical protein